MNTLDAAVDNLGIQDIDFLKVDCEGFEYYILQGGKDSLLRWKPCIVVEQKGTMSELYGAAPQSAVRFLESLGAKVRNVISGDYILSWD